MRIILCFCLVKEGEEQESEQSGDGEAEEEGTESDLVGSTIVNQANGVDIQQLSCFLLITISEENSLRFRAQSRV